MRASLKARPISPARCRAWSSAAAARAISPRSATASTPPRGLLRALGAQRCRCAQQIGRRRRGAAPARRRDRPRAHRARSATSCRLLKRDGGFVRAGYDAALDEARALRDESRRVIAALQARYADDTGVRALKIRHNNVLGYFVEVTAQHGDKLFAAAAQRHLHPSPDARRPGALHHHRAGRARSQDRQRRRPRARHRARNLRPPGGAASPAPPTPSKPRPKRWPRSTSPARWRSSPSNRATCGPRSTARLSFVIAGGRHPVVEQALLARRRAVRGQ